MKAVVVGGKTSTWFGASCRAGCRRAVAEGDVVLAHRIDDAGGHAERRFVVHVDCAAKLIAAAPARTVLDDRADFEAARDRMRAAGSLFAA